MVNAGADVIVCHMGLTTGGSIGAETALSLKDCVALVNEWSETALSIRKDVMVLCHGGPIAMQDDARYILGRCKGLHGFYGASSMERLPAEAAIARQTADFKAVTLGGEKTMQKKKKG